MGTTPEPSPAPLLAVCVGRAAPFGPQGQPSAMAKRPIAGRVKVTTLGLEGDEQADRRNHGGVDKAVHHYPFDHYAAWRTELPECAGLLGAYGAFGENLATLGLGEENVCVGDLFRAGSALLQVSQARQPCWKLDVRFAVSGMARRVQDSRRTGWYYRVVEPGELEPGDTLALVERPHADWSLDRLLAVLYRDCLDVAALAAIAALPSLAPGWRELAAKRLESGQVEDWSRRLSVPT